MKFSAFILFVAAGCGAAGPPESRETNLLKDWTLSRCLARAADGQAFSGDAARTAAVYLEQTRAGMARFEELDALVGRFLAHSNGGSVEGSYQTLKCIDLYHSAELTEVLRERL